MAKSPGLERAAQFFLDIIPPGEPSLDDFRQAFTEQISKYPIAEDATIEAVDAGGVPSLWVTAAGATADRTIVHLHSGGYVMGTAEDYREYAVALSGVTGSRVLVPEYRLAPENPYPAANEDALAAYRFVVAEHGGDASKVVLAGDSAGGGLTMSTLVALRDEGGPLPVAAAITSPLVDLAGEGESMTTNHEIDPLRPADLVPMMGGAYLAGRDPKETPLASPLYAELHGLPPILIQVGSIEGLLDDSRRLAAKIEAAGGEVDLVVWDDMVHIWPLFSSFLPEGRQAIERIAQHIDRTAATVGG